MIAAFRGRTMRIWAGTLLASLAFLVVSASEIAADCSAHERPAISLAGGWKIDLGTIEGTVGAPAARVPEIPRQPRPCTGLMCSSRPAIPLAPAPSRTAWIGSWAIFEGIASLALSERAETLPGEGQFCPISGETSIFHPPRFLPSLPTS
jgi:hypothetical protein